MEDKEREEVDALCPECGHAFKVYIDRLIKDEKDPTIEEESPCPVCGCTECRIGK